MNTHVRLANFASDDDFRFLIECFNHSYRINDHEEPLPFEVSAPFFCLTVKSDQVLIVNRNNKDIGFFINNISEVNDSIGCYCYMHPKACKMAILPLVTCSIIRGGQIGIERMIRWIDVDTWHLMIVTLAKKFFPNMNVHFIRPEYYLMSLDFHDVDISHFSNQLNSREVIFLDRTAYCFSATI